MMSVSRLLDRILSVFVIWWLGFCDIFFSLEAYKDLVEGSKDFIRGFMIVMFVGWPVMIGYIYVKLAYPYDSLLDTFVFVLVPEALWIGFVLLPLLKGKELINEGVE